MIKKTIAVTIIVLLFLGVLPLSTKIAYSSTPYPEVRGIWRFDEGIGTTAYDTSGNGNDGAFYGATLPTWDAAGKYGSALNFSGDDYVDVSDSNSLDVTGAITIEAWVYPQKTAGIIAMKYNHSSLSSSYYLGFGGTGGNKFQFSLSYNGNNYYSLWSSTNVSLMVWTHVAAVMNGTHMMIYQNGVLDGTLLYPPGTIFAGTAHLRFGCYLPEAGYPRYFNGSVDEVKIFSYARSLPFTQWNVDDDKVQKPNADFMSIEEACLAAAPDDTVDVYDGTYNEEVVIDRALKVKSISGASSTIIDGTGVVLASAGLVKIIAGTASLKADVTFDGFTIRNAPAAGTTRIGVLTRSQSTSSVFTISNCKIYGSNNVDEWDDYGYYSSYCKASVVFTKNLVTETGANNIVMEVHTGASQITYNTLDAGVYGTDAIFFMTYNGADVVTLQTVSYNTFDMGTGGIYDYNHRSTGISFSSPGPAWGLTEAKFTKMRIVGNVLNNLQSDRRGIGFWNAGTGNNLQSPVIINNVIHGVPGSTGSYGIDFYGLTANAYMYGNSIEGCAVGVALRSGSAPGTVLRNNNIVGNTVGVDWTIGASAPADARFNWWGAVSGPHHPTSWLYLGLPYGPNLGSGDSVSDYVLYGSWAGLTAPTMAVEPLPVQKQMVNITFDVDVTIADVSIFHRAIGIQFRLLYDPGLIEPVSVTEGSFMTNPQWNLEGIFFLSSIEVDPVYGPSVLVGALILPNGTGWWGAFPTGGGTLATITFKTLVQETGLEKPPLTCDLTLVETQIVSDDLDDAAYFNIVDGVFEMLPTNIADINHDYKVNMMDIGIAAIAFGTVPSDPRWNPIADITGPTPMVPDGKVDMRDIAIVAKNFGWIALDDP